MRRSVIFLLLISLACAALYAQGTSDLERLETLQGKFVRIRAEHDVTMISKTTGIQVLGDRSFVVCETEDEHKRTSRTFVPVDKIITLDSLRLDGRSTGASSPIAERCRH